MYELLNLSVVNKGSVIIEEIIKDFFSSFLRQFLNKFESLLRPNTINVASAKRLRKKHKILGLNKFVNYLAFINKSFIKIIT